MAEILIWLFVQIITKLSEKWWVSQTYLSIGLAILLWLCYWLLTNYYELEWQQAVESIWGIYASSQIFYNLFKKWKLL